MVWKLRYYSIVVDINVFTQDTGTVRNTNVYFTKEDSIIGKTLKVITLNES